MPHRFLIVFLLFALLTAHAQNVTLELGFNGEMVAGQWNPLRLSLRDHPNVELLLSIDQGSLKDGVIPATYSVKLPRRQGLSVFEDDVFLPEWRSLSWLVQSDERILASGSFNRRQANLLPLNLILSSSPAKWLAFFEEGRPVETISHLLPDRVATYGGVQTILLDGSVSAPLLEPLVAAVSSGTTLILVEPLPNTYNDILRLSSTAFTRLGAGEIIKTTTSDLATALKRSDPLDLKLIRESITEEAKGSFPELPPQYPVIVIAGLFSIGLLLILRFGNNITLSTALLLSLMTSFVAWTWLRPANATQQKETRLLVSSGDLAFQQSLENLITLPAQQLELSYSAYPDQVVVYAQTPESVTLDAPRWSNLLFVKKPRLTSAVLAWQDNSLVNTSSSTLSAVYVKGLGFQPDLLAGSLVEVQENKSVNPSNLYTALLPLLPENSVIARDNRTIFVALPEVQP